MTTNRPFFSNFLSAFRARSGIQKASTSPTGGVSGASLSSAYAQAAQAHAQAQQHTSQFGTSTSRPAVTTSTSSDATKPLTTISNTSQPTTHSRPIEATTTNNFQPRRQYHSTSPYSRSPGSPGPGLRPMTGSASSSSSAVHHHHHYHHQQSHAHNYVRERRGSDSSSEGFKETMGAEKWYIGGRTAAGDEKFYKLSMVKKPRSTDRLSFDRISM